MALLEPKMYLKCIHSLVRPSKSCRPLPFWGMVLQPFTMLYHNPLEQGLGMSLDLCLCWLVITTITSDLNWGTPFATRVMSKSTFVSAFGCYNSKKPMEAREHWRGIHSSGECHHWGLGELSGPQPWSPVREIWQYSDQTQDLTTLVLIRSYSLYQNKRIPN